MSEPFVHPAIQSGAIPFVSALCVAAVLGFFAAPTARHAGLAVAVGFLAAYFVTFGPPPLAPRASGQKIAYIAAAAAAAGFILDALAASRRRRMALGLATAAAGALWIGWSRMAAAPSLDHLSMALILAAAAIALYATEADGDDGADKIVPLVVVCIAAAGIAFIGASASIAQNAASLSAALGGLMVLNWPKRRFGLNAAARLVPVVVLAALAGQTVLFTNTPAWTLALLLPALFAGRAVDRVMPAGSRARALTRPVIVAMIAMVPAAAAVAVAWAVASLSGASGGY